MIQAHVRRKMSKEERLAMVQAGREDRGKYLAATAVGKKKVRLMLLHLCFC
jgi:protein SDA1